MDLLLLTLAKPLLTLLGASSFLFLAKSEVMIGPEVLEAPAPRVEAVPAERPPAPRPVAPPKVRPAQPKAQDAPVEEAPEPKP